jgi:hypothetical protein
MLTGFFMLSFLSRLLHLKRKMPTERVGSRPGEISKPGRNRSIYSYYVGNLTEGRAFEGFVPGGRMPSSKYHRKQAEILAGLALSTDDATKAEQFKLAAMEQLDRAQTVDDTEASPSLATGPEETIRSDQGLNGGPTSVAGGEHH